MTAMEADESAIGQWWDIYRDCTRRCDEIRMAVFLRSLAPPIGAHSQRTRVLELIADADEAGLVDTYELTIVGDELCVCERCRSHAHVRPTIETVLELMSWRDGGIQASGFIHCESHSTVAEESHVTVSPPELTLGIYADDTLIGVFPCRADGRTYSPTAFLGQLLREGDKNVTAGERTDETTKRQNEDTRAEADLTQTT